MKLTAIIPALNEEACIGDSVERTLALSLDEVLVVDGGSRDRTAEIAANHGASVLSSPRGRAIQQNLGARRARGDVLLFLHADTWLAPSAGEQLSAALQNSNVMAGAFRQRIDANGMLYRLVERGNALRAGWWGLPYGDQGIFIRRHVFEQLGGFPDVPIMEDLILMRQLRKITRPVLLPGPIHVSPRHWQRHGVLRQTFRNWLLQAAERLCVNPHRLARWYRPDVQQPDVPKGNRPARERVELAPPFEQQMVEIGIGEELAHRPEY